MSELPGIVELRAWLKKKEVSPYRFALNNGLDPSDFGKFLKKGFDARVSVEVAFKIERGTGGDVPARLFVPVREKTR